MQTTTRAIVLSSLKYGDTSLIVKAFTASDGLKSYLLKGVLSSKKTKLKKAYFQPLTQLELVVNHRNRGTLEQIRDARISYQYSSLHTDIIKNAVCMFLSEVIGQCIHEEEQNQDLFSYLEASLQWLDAHEKISNFHILFMLKLSKYLGFYPESLKTEGGYFDLEQGTFCKTRPSGLSVSGADLDNFRSFLGIHFDALEGISLGRVQRDNLLQILLEYFQLHLHGFRKPRSLAILKEVFS